MKEPTQGAIEPYLVKIQCLNTAIGARAVRGRTGEWRLHVKTRGGHRTTYVVELLEVQPTTALAVRLAERQAANHDVRWMVLAPRVPPPVAAALIEKDIDYVDLAGNCHLAPTPDQLVHVEKRAPERIRGTRNIRPQGYQVVFALLARPELIAEPVREIAMQAGVGKTVVGQTLERLEEEGFIGGNGRKRKLINRARLLTKWLTGYADVLRPRWILGRFRTAKEGKEELPDRVEDYFKGQTEDRPWGFGGTVAADNLTQHYRGFEIVVHTEELPADFARTLRALAAPTGDLIVMRTPGPLAYKGPLPHVVHPLLVYTELMAGDDERAWETARMVLDQYLPELK